MGRFIVRSEGPKGESRVTEIEAVDDDEARFLVEGQNRDLAASDSAPESKPYKIVSAEPA